MSDLERLIQRAEQLIARFESTLATAPAAPDWNASLAYRWRKRGAAGGLVPVAHPHNIRLIDLQGIDAQIRLVEQNTRQFIEGLTANNVLLTGARGTGKSSLIKAVLNQYAPRGLAIDRSRKTRASRSARHHRSGGRVALQIYPVLRRFVF